MKIRILSPYTVIKRYTVFFLTFFDIIAYPFNSGVKNCIPQNEKKV
ncbi:MAG: hypothetical protein PHW77_02055 [Eubacteriales bacterium]|nr:hypothetical protein [Eubacteriales bacterium]